MIDLCANKTDGLYDDPHDCDSFVVCFSRSSFRTKCAFGTVWNSKRKECDWPNPENVDCKKQSKLQHSTKARLNFVSSVIQDYEMKTTGWT
jgi:hypothetical protein